MGNERAKSATSEMSDSSLLAPVTIRILMLTDDRGNYAEADSSSLILLIKALEESTGSLVNFDITRAHRSNGIGVQKPNFVFDPDKEFKPGDYHYDEVWMFGILPSPGVEPFTNLTDKELRALSRFMDDGNGVFATGDHEDTGAGLSGQVPRVRSMRKWYFSEPHPPGRPKAPPRDHELRHDTLRKGLDGKYSLAQEKDVTPQVIFPKLYTLPFSSTNPLETCPHPVLSGEKGAIKFLPDHIHEGECFVPSNLEERFKFDGFEGDEYPALDGTRLAPEVIAIAQIPEPHSTEDSDITHRPTQVTCFGVIGAYEGHLVNVGRVVVDASWHHFFWYNLEQFEKSEDQSVYKEIKNYFRNIGIWLAHDSKQESLRNRALWLTRWSYPLAEAFSPRTVKARLHEADPDYLLKLGATARDTLNSIVSPCISLQWILNLSEEFMPEGIGLSGYYPWKLDPATETKKPFGLDINSLVNILLGGIMLEIADSFPQIVRETFEKVGADLIEVIKSGIETSIRSLQSI
jgi:hypothetical protein